MELFIKRFVWCVLVLLNLLIIASIISYIISLFVIDVSNYEVSSPKIPKAFNEYKIVQISDLHNNLLGKNNKRLIEKIDSQSPDIVVLTGDMISTNNRNYSNFYNFAKQIATKYPTYFVLGNHEQDLSSLRLLDFITTLRSYKVNVIMDSKETLYKDDNHINLYGIFYSSDYYKHQKGYDFSTQLVKESLGEPNKSEFNILLSHNPFFFDNYSEWGADLTLAGHVHGGIFRLPHCFGLLSPERKLFPKYFEGIYENNKNKMVVSRGLGNSTLNLRVFNNPEIVTITLKSL